MENTQCRIALQQLIDQGASYELIKNELIDICKETNATAFMDNELLTKSLHALVYNAERSTAGWKTESSNNDDYYDLNVIISYNDKFFYKISGEANSYTDEADWTDWKVVSPLEKNITVYE